MALEAKNINTIEDMQRFVEGCLNDMDFGISTKEETLNNLKDYTLRVIKLSASQKVDKSDRQLTIPDVSNRSELLLAFVKFCKNENGLHIPLSYINEFLKANNCG